MLKKALIILSIFCLIIFTSNFVFASNMVNGARDMLNDAEHGIENMVNGATNAAKDAKNGVTDMMEDMGDGVKKGADDVKRGTEDMARGMTNNTGYTATRTSATDGMTSNPGNALVWIILAIVGVAIVALVWYYATQTDDKYTH